MVKFLELIMKPLEKISNTEDLVNLLSICDAVAVGFTPLTGTSRSYNIWYNVALKFYEFDPIGELCFGAVTSGDLASDLGVDSLPNARLMLWNDTKEYKSEDSNQSWNETILANWLLENFSQPVARIIPMWKKSLNFNRYADGNPMLILFTPLNPLYEQLPSYALLREVAMEYYTCKNNASNEWTSELIKLQQVKRLLYHKKSFMKFCQEYKYNKPVKKATPQYKKPIVSQNNKYPWINVTQKNQKTGMANFLLKQGLALSKLIERSNDYSALWSTLGFLENCGESSSQSLPAEKGFYENYEKCQSFEEQFNNDLEMEQEDVETSMLPYDDDPLSAESLWHEHVKHFCRRMLFAHSVSPPVSPAKVSHGNITHIHGPACDTNYTISMIAVDSFRNYHFAESLGVDIKNKKDMTAVVILDSKHESQYVLSEEYTAKSIRDFIYNFTQKRLNRTLRSRIDDATHTHYFGSVGGTEPDGKDDSAVHIVDLTTHTFQEVVRTPGTVTVLAVCGGGCGALVSRALVQAARVLAACGVRVQPARIDALRHELPWQYTPPAHPTLLVFPAHRRGEAESRAFPGGERVTASGVVALVLRELGAPTHLRVSLALCAHSKITSEKTSCLRNMREHVTTAISRNLKYWRRTELTDLRASLFKRLEHLHDVALQLSLFHITDLRQQTDKQNTLLQSLDRLATIWDIDETLLRKNVIPKPIVAR
ncbi:thioredoxin domain-containing protein 11 isoform X2 [Bicyclus anynana]|nr:thioredoxin domain-containing protein 11 isoform X2 [Bicyclus anynana]